MQRQQTSAAALNKCLACLSEPGRAIARYYDLSDGQAKQNGRSHQADVLWLPLQCDMGACSGWSFCNLHEPELEQALLHVT